MIIIQHDKRAKEEVCWETYFPCLHISQPFIGTHKNLAPSKISNTRTLITPKVLLLPLSDYNIYLKNFKLGYVHFGPLQEKNIMEFEKKYQVLNIGKEKKLQILHISVVSSNVRFDNQM